MCVTNFVQQVNFVDDDIFFANHSQFNLAKNSPM